MRQYGGASLLMFYVGFNIIPVLNEVFLISNHASVYPLQYQAWGDYTAKVINCECDYFKLLRMRMQLRLQ